MIVEEDKVLHCLNVRLARRGKPQAQELTIPLMTQELMMDDPRWKTENKTRNALIWKIMTRFMPQTALAMGSHTQPDSTSLADGTAISQNTSRQAKELQRRDEGTMEVEDGGEE